MLQSTDIFYYFDIIQRNVFALWNLSVRMIFLSTVDKVLYEHQLSFDKIGSESISSSLCVPFLLPTVTYFIGVENDWIHL